MPFLLSKDDLDRVRDSVDFTETRPVNGKTPSRRTPILQSGDIAEVRITSTTTTAGRYPGKLIRYDPVAVVWTDVMDVWIVDVNAGALIVARYLGRRESSANGRPVYIVSAGGSLTDLCVLTCDTDCINGAWSKVTKTIHFVGSVT